MKPSNLLILEAFRALEREKITKLSETLGNSEKIIISRKITKILEAIDFFINEADKGSGDHLLDAVKYATDSFKAKTSNHLDDHFRMALKNQMVSLPPTSFKGFDPGALNQCAYCDSEIPGINDRKDWPEQRSEIGICLPCWSEMDNSPPGEITYKEAPTTLLGPSAPPSPQSLEGMRNYLAKRPPLKKKAKKRTSSKKSNPKLPKTTNEACDHLEYREV